MTHRPLPDAPSLAALPERLVRRVDSELRPGERVLWVGQPHPDYHSALLGRLTLAGTALCVASLLPAVGLLVSAAVRGGGLRATWPLVAIGTALGTPVALAGVVMVIVHRWVRRTARATCYLLTNERAVVLEPKPFGGHAVRSYRHTPIGTILGEGRADGSGSLIFEVRLGTDQDGMRTRRPRGFLAIEDVRFVEALVRRTLGAPPG